MKKLVTLGVLVLATMAGQLLAQPLSRFLLDAPLASVRMAPEDALLPSSYRALTLDEESLQRQLLQIPTLNDPNASAGVVLEFPVPDGSTQRFRVQRSSVMAPGLAAKFPEIQTFKGRGIDDPTATMVMDHSPKGLHVMIMGAEGTFLINPLHHVADEQYLVFNKKEAQIAPEYTNSTCGLEERTRENESSTRDVPLAVGDQMFRYRIAVATSAAYTAFHGGTVSDAISAVTTVINRISGVYEREVAISLELVADNDQLVYIGSDPFFSTPTTIGNNLTFLTDTISNRIGFNNFDIGHLFTRVGAQGGIFVAGIAFRGVVCTNLKGAGISSLPTPSGDAFAIDVSAHEMGHQFNSPHGFNTDAASCIDQRSAANAYEPGSGSTIMCYPGTCNPHNLQNAADDYFHSGSRDYIIDYTRTGNGSFCGTPIPNNNNTIPDVTVPASGFFIPIGTPFELIGSGTDADGDALTYCWEQMNLGPAGNPDFPIANAPIFRTFNPGPNANRVFPILGSILNNSTVIGEKLPTYSRDMTFHLTARDNRGGARVAEVDFKATDNAGPFQVTYPNIFEMFDAETYLNVTWDVAGTDQAPVNTAEVDIFMSTDAGLTYPLQLADNVPNDGEHLVLLPAISNNFNRIRIQAADNIYFDISNGNFGIQQPANATFSFYQLNTVSESCPGGDPASFTILTTSIGGFADSMDFFAGGLPAGVTATFTPALIAPGDTAILTLNVNGPLAPGDYDFFVRAFAGGQTSPQFDYTLNILEGGPPAVLAINPPNGTPGASVTPEFVWDPIPGAIDYSFVISAAADFSNPITTANNLTTNSFSLALPLLPEEVYYWRVIARNICGSSPNTGYAFKTGTCVEATSTDVPKTIPLFGSPAVVTSTLNVSAIGSISDVNVLGLEGTHSELNDLEFILRSPAGTEVVLFSGICNDGVEDFNLNLDDEAVDSVLSCPPTSGGFFRPTGSLADFQEEAPDGTWSLIVRDIESFEGGSLDGWGLEICTSTNGDAPSLITNTPLTINRWAQADIGQTQLEATDPTGPTNTTFTLVTLPSHGGLLLNGSNIFPGAVFTQEDINNGSLAYLHNGDSVANSDAFTFTVENPNGGWFGTPSFQINITQTTSVNPSVALPAVQVFPNPVWDRLMVKMETPSSASAWSVDLVSLQGQILARRQGGANQVLDTHFDVGELASGLYLVRVRTALGQQLVKVSVK